MALPDRVPLGQRLTPRPAFEEVAEVTLKPGVPNARGAGAVGEGLAWWLLSLRRVCRARWAHRA